jgi:anti-sigma B factor antagonist
MTDHHTAAAFGTSSDGSIVTVRCAGELDLASSPRMRDALLASLRDGVGGLVADLSSTTFCDSTVFSVLVEVHRAALDRQVPYAIAADRVAVARPLEILGLDRLLPLHESLDAARTAVAGRRGVRVS